MPLRTRFVHIISVACTSLALAACGSDTNAADEASVSDDGSQSEGPSDDIDAAGTCEYVSPFTQGAECREFGAAWTGDEVSAACDELGGTVGQSCDDGDVLGRCILDGGSDEEVQIVVYGTDTSACEAQVTGCEVFGGGQWQPDGCDGADGGAAEPPAEGTVFIQPTRICREPLPGEPVGQSEGGQVCTWESISGSTEEGRRFDEYASCDVVRTQRPYYPAPANEALSTDERLGDDQYAQELDWVRDQMAASGCVCCHSDSTPLGPSNWTIDAPGNWIDTFYDSGLAMGAGWIDSTSFGAYDPEDNNGFDRSFGFPTTDLERMRAFFEAELAQRGLVREDFVDAPPFGGPLFDQLVYEPTRCEEGEGVSRDLTVTWNGGSARYVYVLEAGSDNPTVPPNLDLPQGTLWRMDVPSDAVAVADRSLSYGEPSAGMEQRFPVSDAPAALIEGNDYYLYVLADVGLPITRCIFEF